jgi:hypothetical protein
MSKKKKEEDLTEQYGELFSKVPESTVKGFEVKGVTRSFVHDFTVSPSPISSGYSTATIFSDEGAVSAAITSLTDAAREHTRTPIFSNIGSAMTSATISLSEEDAERIRDLFASVPSEVGVISPISPNISSAPEVSTYTGNTEVRLGRIIITENQIIIASDNGRDIRINQNGIWAGERQLISPEGALWQ